MSITVAVWIGMIAVFGMFAVLIQDMIKRPHQRPSPLSQMVTSGFTIVWTLATAFTSARFGYGRTAVALWIFVALIYGCQFVLSLRKYRAEQSSTVGLNKE